MTLFGDEIIDHKTQKRDSEDLLHEFNDVFARSSSHIFAVDFEYLVPGLE